MVMENKELDMVTDVMIPSIIIGGLFLINAIILYFIFQKRKTIVYEQYDNTQVPEEPTTSQPLFDAPKPTTTEDNEAGIELEKV